MSTLSDQARQTEARRVILDMADTFATQYKLTHEVEISEDNRKKLIKGLDARISEMGEALAEYDFGRAELFFTRLAKNDPNIIVEGTTPFFQRAKDCHACNLFLQIDGFDPRQFSDCISLTALPWLSRYIIANINDNECQYRGSVGVLRWHKIVSEKTAACCDLFGKKTLAGQTFTFFKAMEKAKNQSGMRLAVRLKGDEVAKAQEWMPSEPVAKKAKINTLVLLGNQLILMSQKLPELHDSENAICKSWVQAYRELCTHAPTRAVKLLENATQYKKGMRPNTPLLGTAIDLQNELKRQGLKVPAWSQQKLSQGS